MGTEGSRLKLLSLSPCIDKCSCATPPLGLPSPPFSGTVTAVCRKECSVSTVDVQASKAESKKGVCSFHLFPQTGHQPQGSGTVYHLHICPCSTTPRQDQHPHSCSSTSSQDTSTWPPVTAFWFLTHSLHVTVLQTPNKRKMVSFPLFSFIEV